MAENKNGTETLSPSNSTEASNNFLRKTAKIVKDSFVWFSGGAVANNAMVRVGEILTSTTLTAAERDAFSLRGGVIGAGIHLVSEAGLALSNKRLNKSDNPTTR